MPHINHRRGETRRFVWRRDGKRRPYRGSRIKTRGLFRIGKWLAGCVCCDVDWTTAEVSRYCRRVLKPAAIRDSAAV